MDQGRKVPCLEGIYGYLDSLKAWGNKMKGQLLEITALQPEAK